MASIINSDDGVISGTSGLKTTGGNDGITTFQQNGTEAMRINSSGDVGIGTTSPAAELDVVRSLNGSTVEILVANTFYAASSTDEAVAFQGEFYQNDVAARRAAGYIQFTKAGDFSNNANASANMIFGTRNAGTVAERARITAAGLFQFDSGYGSVATAYGCRAWVNFNGTGTVAIQASGNVTSITDNGTGDYTVNFTNALADANYCVTTTAQVISDQGSSYQFGLRTLTNTSTAPTTKTTTAVRLLSRRESDVDLQNCNVAIFR